MKHLSVMALLCFCLITFFSCNKEEEPFTIQETTDLAENRYFEPWCLTCEGIDVNIEKIGNEDGCCIYKVSVDHEPECGAGTRHFIYENGEYVSIIQTNWYEFTFRVCEGETKEITVIGKTDETGAGPWNATCFSQIISCDCDCESTSLDYNLLETDSDDCCIYKINANIEDFSDKPEVCGYSIQVGDNNYPITSGVFTVEATTCEGEDLTVGLYQGEILCQEMEISCEAIPVDFCDYFEYEEPNIIDDECCFVFKTISDASFAVQFFNNDNINLEIDKEFHNSTIDGELQICVPYGQSIKVTLLDIGPNTTLTPEETAEVYNIFSLFCWFNC